jgi:FkbM family methyltransferase
MFGYEVRRIPSERSRMNFRSAIRHLNAMDYSPRTVIDVGAANGTYELYDAFPDAFHILIEPLIENEDSLKEVCRLYQADYVLAAAGAEQSTTEINVHGFLDGSSILDKCDQENIRSSKREIPIVAIDDLVKDNQLQGPYMIKADVQGFELQVLKGAENTLLDTEVVVLEARLFESYNDAPELYELLEAMKDYGYVVYDMTEFLFRPLDGAMMSMDVVFVKENSYLRDNKNYGSKQQMELIYG